MLILNHDIHRNEIYCHDISHHYRYPHDPAPTKCIYAHIRGKMQFLKLQINYRISNRYSTAKKQYQQFKRKCQIRC